MKLPTLQEQNDEIRKECARLADFMVGKNTAYGGQALAPIAIVSKGDPLDIIFARMDDKLSRILRGQTAGEDPWQDLRGYITLWQVVKALKAKGFYAPKEQDVIDGSPMPMPIDQRYVEHPSHVSQTGPVNGSVEIDFGEEESVGGETLERPGQMVLEADDDPTNMSVQDIGAIVNQTVTSLQPKVPDTFDELVRPESGSPIAGEDDPWVALQRPIRKKTSGGPTSLSAEPKL